MTKTATTEAYPLAWPQGWPRSKGRKGFGAFQVTPEKAFTSLLENIRKLPASSIVISSNCRLSRTGLPYYEDARATNMADPGVAAYFMYRGRQMSMAQDAYNAPFANARSLALAVEAMRAIERHGGGHMMERSFDGFAALPPPDGSAAFAKRPWRVVMEMEGIMPDLPKDAALAIAEAYYKRLARERHPDSDGGSHEMMAELNIAIQDAREELR